MDEQELQQTEQEVIKTDSTENNGNEIQNGQNNEGEVSQAAEGTQTSEAQG